MGSLHSKHNASQPAPEPVVLLKTSAGVIVRVPDATSGNSVFHHNPRFIQHATLTDALGSSGESRADPQVLVARAGVQNDALKGKVVYVKKPPRQQSRDS